MKKIEAITEAKAKGIKDILFNAVAENFTQDPPMNPLLGIENEKPLFEGASDTPIELLHCCLLGIIEYATVATVKGLGVERKQRLKSSLESVMQSGILKKLQGHPMVSQDTYLYLPLL
ncbi:hypothetical protein BDR26DRAFT_943703 [Obelidium mucronatum]|nr:hypothetical protein BDR26DRAFT_943703 [Obelidium mucronatum]